MREHKYRFWNKEKKFMCGWEIAIKECNRLSLLNLEPWVALEFTGLPDKHGVEIYESDIVKIGNGEFDSCGVHLVGGDGIHVVEYDSKTASFTNTHTTNGLGEIFNHNIEIIGNVFENPDLNPLKRNV